MSKYQIVRWDVVTDCNNILRPMLYFKPDMDMVLFSRDNNFKVHIDINDAQFYSGELLSATIDIAAQQPNFRPNFFEACHLYVITLLEVNWVGFPTIGAEGSFTLNKNVVPPKCWQNYGIPGSPKRNSVEVASVMEVPANMFISEQQIVAKDKAKSAEDAKVIQTTTAINSQNAEDTPQKHDSVDILLDALKKAYTNSQTQQNTTLAPPGPANANLTNITNNHKQTVYSEPYRSSLKRSNKGLVSGLIILTIILLIFIIILASCGQD